LATNSTGVVSIDDNGGAITVDGTVTANLSATDNAVLDTIDAVLDTIKEDTEAIETAVEALQTGQLADGHNVTVDNASIAVTGTFWQETQPISGTVTANLSATDNTVLDNIDSDTSAIQTAVQLIDDAIYVDDADWSADTSKHILAGAVTQVVATANTDGDTTPLSTNAFRELRVAIPESDLATATTAHVKKYYTSAGAATDGIIWSPAAGKRWYVTDIFINVSAAATITLEDDLAAGDSAVWKAELAANSGWSHSFTTPLYSGEDAADLIITTTAGNVYVTVTGYEI